MLCYCKKCGRLVQRLTKELNKPCDYCQNKLQLVPEEYLGGQSKGFIKKELKDQFIEEYIKSSPEFDENLFNHRDEDLYNRRVSNQAKIAIGKAIIEEQSKTVKCTYCGSSNVKKIGLLNRAISTELWGFGSKKIGKQFHCNHCGADF